MSQTASSRVQLTLVSLIRQHGQHVQPMVGTSRVCSRDEGVHLVAGSIPFHSREMDAKAPTPGKGVLALFGIRDALDELQHWRAVARTAQAQFAYLQLQVEVGMPAPGAVTREMLRAHGAQLRFLNVRRSAAEFQKELLAQFATWVAQEGGDPARDMAHVRQMALRPDLFERLLYEDPDLQHIDVMVLPLADRPDPTRLRQVAYVRAGTPLEAQAQGSDQVQVHLPVWMAQRYGPGQDVTSTPCCNDKDVTRVA